MKNKITIALAGNPNSGKTTVFNNLTGSRQHVGNYPGVTVDIKEGTFKHDEVDIRVIDLPGTYSLTAYSEEEMVARRFILDEKPDVIVDIIDASNLERNLYLAIQLLEMKVRMVLAFNMSDVAEKRGIRFDLEKLSALLGVPIIRTVGSRNEGTENIIHAAFDVLESQESQTGPNLFYGRELEEEITRLTGLLAEETPELEPGLRKWNAIKLLEHDSDVEEHIQSERIRGTVRESRRHLRGIFKDNPEIIFADRRYGFISGVCTEAVTFTVERRHDISDRIDTILINKIVGIPIFLALMYLVFQLTFTAGAYPMVWLEHLFGWLGRTISGWWPVGSESLLRSLLVDGIIGGVGGVITFLPNILLLFAAIAVLEDSGYMARAAFIMDTLMHKIGLHGKSFIPMLIGFGCSVPGIMATRTIESRKDRLTTMLILPLMSCGARLPIYALIIPAFFAPAWRGPMLWSIYLIGIVIAILCARLLKGTILKGEATPFIMELPPYRVPTIKGVVIHTWERGREYIKKAGTIILGISIILWFLTTFPAKKEFDRDYNQLAIDASGIHTQEIARIEALLPGSRTPGNLQAVLKGPPGNTGADSNSEPSQNVLLFLHILEQADRIEGDVAALTAEESLEPEDTEYILLLADARRRHDDLNMRYPEIYPLVMRYAEKMRTPYQEHLRHLADQQLAEQISYTAAGRIGHAIAPLLKPMGFDWRIGTALLGAMAAKEVFVAQLGIVFAVGETDQASDALRDQLQQEYSPLVAFCIMLFCLISTPCIATIAITRKESGTWKWALFQLAGLTVLAYILTVAVYWTGRLLGCGP